MRTMSLRRCVSTSCIACARRNASSRCCRRSLASISSFHLLTNATRSSLAAGGRVGRRRPTRECRHLGAKPRLERRQRRADIGLAHRGRRGLRRRLRAACAAGAAAGSPVARLSSPIPCGRRWRRCRTRPGRWPPRPARQAGGHRHRRPRRAPATIVGSSSRPARGRCETRDRPPVAAMRSDPRAPRADLDFLRAGRDSRQVRLDLDARSRSLVSP